VCSFILIAFFYLYREFRKEQVRVNAMLRRAAVERDAEQARLAYLQRMHEIEVRADIFPCICAVEAVTLCCSVALCQPVVFRLWLLSSTQPSNVAC
jgi:hypothetical protein